MGKVREVVYVVGSFLCFPVCCRHFIEEDDDYGHDTNSEKQVASSDVKKVRGRGRCTCGNSQKSVRMKYGKKTK